MILLSGNPINGSADTDHKSFENTDLSKLQLKRILVMQSLGKKKFPFSSVVLVQMYDNETLMTGFITDEYPDGRCSVFVPTGPNPTTGFIFHLKSEYVHPGNVSVEEANRSMISCGAGMGKSNSLLSLRTITYSVWVYSRPAFFVSSRTAIRKQDRGRR